MARGRRIPTTYAGGSLDFPGHMPAQSARSPSLVPDQEHAPEMGSFDPNEPQAPREPLVMDQEGKESDAYWTIPAGTFPLFPWEKKFRQIAKKFGRIGGVRVAKKINGKFRDEMLKMPDGRIDSKPYDNQKFTLSDIEEIHGPGEYQTILYSELSSGNAPIWTNYWTVTGGQRKPFPCEIPPSAQGFDPALDDEPEFNPTGVQTEQSMPESPRNQAPEGPSLFEQHAGGGMSDMMGRRPPFGGSPFGGGGNPFAREEPKPEPEDKFMKFLTPLLAAAAPIGTAWIQNMMDSAKHDRELARQREERDEERRRQDALERKRDREHEQKLEEDRELRRAEERRQRLAEERQRIEWEDRRRKDDEERQRNRDDYEQKKRLDEEDRQARLEQQRQQILEQQFNASRPQVDPQIVQMVAALNTKIESMQKVGPLGGLKEMLSDFSTMKSELEALGLAGGSAPQGESGMEGFIGRILGSIPPDRAAALFKTVGSAIGMLPAEAMPPSSINLT